MRRLALPGLAAAFALIAAGSALTQEPVRSADSLVSDFRVASFRLRTGRYELAASSVAALEAGVQAYPRDARLWTALGSAYFQQITADVNAGAFRDVPGHLVKARDAHARALEIDPDNPNALAGHGEALAIASTFMRRPDLGQQGMTEMNRAVALAPDSTLVRLQRGFTNLGVPATLRDPQAAEEDLKRLIRLSDGRRPGDVLHVLLGDLYAETGKPDLARAQYATAARPTSAAREMAQGRLEALAQGAPPTGEITRLRNDLGRNCAMCHGG